MSNKIGPFRDLDAIDVVLSIAPVARNGDTTNVVNGAAVDLRGLGAVLFSTIEGVMVGSANVAYHLQENADDDGGGSWTNISGKTLAAATDENVARKLWYNPEAGDRPQVRIVQTVDANVVTSGVTHQVFD